MPAPYIRETQRGGIWCVMFKDSWPQLASGTEQVRCGIVAAFTSEEKAREYADTHRDRIQYLEEVTS